MRALLLLRDNKCVMCIKTTSVSNMSNRKGESRDKNKSHLEDNIFHMADNESLDWSESNENRKETKERFLLNM